MKKLIILEGFDGTGKTTLGKQIAYDFDIPYIDLFYPKSNYDKQYLTSKGITIDRYHQDFYFYEVWNRTRFEAVMDRSAISDFAYNNYDKKLFKTWLHHFFGIHKEDILLIYLHTDILTIMHRDKQWTDKKHIERILRKYRILINKIKNYGIDVIELDTTHGVSGEMLEYLYSSF